MANLLRLMAGLCAPVFVGGALMLACGDDSTNTGTGDDGGTGSDATYDGQATGDGAPGDGSTPTTGDMAVTATYMGAKKGPIIMTAFTTFPPSGPPEAIGTVEKPQLPGTNVVTVKGIKPGTYVVSGYILVGADTPQHRMGPQAGDPVVFPPGQTHVTIVAGQSAAVSVDLKDVGGGGDGGSDAGDSGIMDASDSG